MKAAFIERHGGPEVLKFGEMPDPVAAAGEVVVDIVAASVNGADWKVREGKSGQLSRFPYILGRDFSGVVSALGRVSRTCVSAMRYSLSATSARRAPMPRRSRSRPPSSPGKPIACPMSMPQRLRWPG